MNDRNPTAQSESDYDIQPLLLAALDGESEHLAFEELMAMAFEPDHVSDADRRRIEAHVGGCYTCAAHLYRLSSQVLEPSHWVEVLIAFLRTSGTENRELVAGWGAAWVDSTPPRIATSAELTAASGEMRVDSVEETPTEPSRRGLNPSLKLWKTSDGVELNLRAKSRQRPVVVAVRAGHPPEVLLPSDAVWDSVLYPEKKILLPLRYRGGDVMFVGIGLDPDARIRLDEQDAETVLAIVADDIEDWRDAQGDHRYIGQVRSIYVLRSDETMRRAGSP